MMCGDSTNDGDVAALMDGVKANLVVTDPPYNVAYESADGKTIQNDSMEDGKFYDFLLAAFKNMPRIWPRAAVLISSTRTRRA